MATEDSKPVGSVRWLSAQIPAGPTRSRRCDLSILSFPLVCLSPDASRLCQKIAEPTSSVPLARQPPKPHSLRACVASPPWHVRHNTGSLSVDECAGSLEYPFQNKQGKSCMENLARAVEKEEKIGWWSSSGHCSGTDIPSSQHTGIVPQ